MAELNLNPVEFDPMEWKAQAACRGMDTALFFPKQGEPNTEALKVCKTCPVAEPCLAFALKNFERFGVWGGRSERQRRHYRREIRLTAVKP